MCRLGTKRDFFGERGSRHWDGLPTEGGIPVPGGVGAKTAQGTEHHGLADVVVAHRLDSLIPKVFSSLSGSVVSINPPRCAL